MSTNVMDCKWLYRIKRKADGSIDHFKDRLVSKNFTQHPGLDFHETFSLETFSLVVKPTTITLLLSIVVQRNWPIYQLDVNNAFIQVKLDEEVFMSQPRYFINPQFPTYVCRLKKAIYGIKQVPRAWYNALREHLLKLRFVRTESYTSLFVWKHLAITIYVLVYVDDIVQPPIEYVQIPVGIAGPLALDGKNYFVPIATTEGCLVASTNRGCKAIYASGGATSVLLGDGMTGAPAVRFDSAKRAAELKFFVEDPMNLRLYLKFSTSEYSGPSFKSSRFARLQNIQCAIAGKNLYMRFRCSTGNEMGMNMASEGVQNVLEHLKNKYPDMDIITISGNYCSDKKLAAVNWVEGRGKSVVCEATIEEEVLKKVLKTEVADLVELNIRKNLICSTVAGALGGFNAHAINIVTAIYIATGQDPAQNIESSHCITMMEAVNDGKDLHISLTMLSIEVGTVGGKLNLHLNQLA
ncbi:3-hydroxy-3-methylglutaryl-coenzyme A reductase 2 [Capsicum annuum]|uniref:hydroxymethylglutaryl-CoA reductase (NADPH) n=1 Tax=Capsicum annuum TaxID=4072 RepID=A0A2G3AHU8_CAPAN|nr:3-hydroxy-3-methylglutaryl-coenzyme A reductase 2 [Capsicum annuum]PHT93821.1 3-hydroxy-3-methylglutaryl-coenzyme A reductase 2 [Capsicum annuum]